MSNFSTHALAYTSCNENYKLLPTPSVTATAGNMAQYVSSQVGGKTKKRRTSKRRKTQRVRRITRKKKTRRTQRVRNTQRVHRLHIF